MGFKVLLKDIFGGYDLTTVYLVYDLTTIYLVYASIKVQNDAEFKWDMHWHRWASEKCCWFLWAKDHSWVKAN